MNASFYRKVLYFCLIVLLWFPLSFIGRPVSIDEDGRRSGGTLVQLRDDNFLSQASLGEIDPTSESMKLATLGMRGVALNVLWTMANEYKKKEDFDNMAATINQITLLAPNFVAVWEFQAHNETYNVSVEYDAYRMRYAWVKKGIDLLIRGTEFNGKDTRLVNYLSWFFGQKLGRADEHVQFRRLFREDTDYHNKLTETLKMQLDDRDVVGPDRKSPDNWLVGRKVQLRAVSLVESQNVPIRGKSPLLFFADACMLRINYSKAIENEGWLGDVAGEAWQQSGQDWKEYGERPIPTSWGHDIRLGDQEKFQKVADDAINELNADFAPGVYDRMVAERKAKLRPEELKAIETPQDKRTEQQMMLAMEAEGKIQVHIDEVADAAPADKLGGAKKLARKVQENIEMASRIERYRDIVNYRYWKTRCEAEQSPEALAARQYIKDAENAFDEGILEGSNGAKELYEQAWKQWAKVYEKHPALMDDVEADSVSESIDRYRHVLVQLDIRSFPADFPLYRFLEVQRKGGQVLQEIEKSAPPKTDEPASEEKKSDDKKTDEESKKDLSAEDTDPDTKKADDEKKSESAIEPEQEKKSPATEESESK